MPRAEKVNEVERLQERLRGAAAVILTDFRGLTVGEITTLRGKLRAVGADYRVVKNRLLAIAGKGSGIEGLDAYLTGPTAAAFVVTDPVGAAKAIQEFIRQTRKLIIKASVVDGRVFNEVQTRALADLPGRPQLLARLVGGVAAPLAGLHGVLSGLPRKLVYALDQVRQHRERGVGAEGVGAKGA